MPDSKWAAFEQGGEGATPGMGICTLIGVGNLEPLGPEFPPPAGGSLGPLNETLEVPAIGESTVREALISRSNATAVDPIVGLTVQFRQSEGSETPSGDEIPVASAHLNASDDDLPEDHYILGVSGSGPAPPTPVAPHEYWRILGFDPGASMTELVLSEIRFLEDGVDVTDDRIAISPAFGPNVGSIANWTDGDLDTVGGWDAGSGVPPSIVWIMMRFDAGDPKGINGVMLGASDDPAAFPSNFCIEWSDDSFTWTESGCVTDIPYPGDNTYTPAMEPIPDPPVADFSVDVDIGVDPLTCTFTDLTLNSPSSWLWEKNDGGGWLPFDGTPTAQNPVEVFTEGDWIVRLTATNVSGSDTETKTGTVNDYIISEVPMLWSLTDKSADTEITHSQFGALVDVTENAVRTTRRNFVEGRRGKWYWEVEILFHPTNGSIRAGLLSIAQALISGTPASGGRCATTFDGGVGITSNQWDEHGVGDPTVAVGDFWQFAYDQPAGKLFIGYMDTFFNSSDPAAGTNPSFDNTDPPSEVYAMSFSNESTTPFGISEVLLRVHEDDFRGTMPAGFIAAGHAQPPITAFTGTPLSGTAPLSVAFTDTSNGGTPTSWLWEKNDGGGWVPFDGTPTAQNPTEDFDEGTWDVRLTATNAAGSDDSTRTDYVEVDPAPSPHRYWRLGSIVNPGTELEISEIQLIEAGVVRSAGVTPTTTGGFSPYIGSLALWVDGNLSNRCGFTHAQVINPAFTIVWDFGAGTPRLIDAVKQAGYDTATLFMSGFTLSWSDDNSTWTVLGSKAGLTYPGNFTLSAAYTFP